MQSFITVGDYQRVLKEYYQKTGERLQFHEAMHRLERQGLISHALPKPDQAQEGFLCKTPLRLNVFPISWPFRFS